MEALNNGMWKLAYFFSVSRHFHLSEDSTWVTWGQQLYYFSLHRHIIFVRQMARKMSSFQLQFFGKSLLVLQAIAVWVITLLGAFQVTPLQSENLKKKIDPLGWVAMCATWPVAVHENDKWTFRKKQRSGTLTNTCSSASIHLAKCTDWSLIQRPGLLSIFTHSYTTVLV